MNRSIPNVPLPCRRGSLSSVVVEERSLVRIVYFVIGSDLLESFNEYKQAVRRPPQYAPAPCKLTFDRLTVKVVSELRVTWATSVPILVFLGLSVLDLGLMYATDRRQTSDAHHRLMPPYPRHNNVE